MTEAMSMISLTNKCFNKCVVKHVPVLITSDIREKQLMTPKLRGVLDHTLKINKETQKDWCLSEKETICVHNCSKEYVGLKEILHE